MWVVSAIVLVLAIATGAAPAAVTTALTTAMISFAIAIATLRARSSRQHLDWFTAQCACVTVASLALRAFG